MFTEKLKQLGEISLELIKPNGDVERVDIKNLVVNAGLAGISKRMYDNAAPFPTHIGVGSGTTAAAATQTALVSQLGSRMPTGTPSTVTVSTTNDGTRWAATFGAGAGTGAITEIGLFTAATGGDMWARSVFAVLNKAAEDVLVVTWTVRTSA